LISRLKPLRKLSGEVGGAEFGAHCWFGVKAETVHVPELVRRCLAHSLPPNAAVPATVRAQLPTIPPHPARYSDTAGLCAEEPRARGEVVLAALVAPTNAGVVPERQALRMRSSDPLGSCTCP
jgi:hypothetical protein